MTKQHSMRRTLFTSKLDLNVRKKLVACYNLSIALYAAETLTVQTDEQKYLESFEMWCWRMIVKISLTDHVRNVIKCYKVVIKCYKESRRGRISNIQYK